MTPIVQASPPRLAQLTQYLVDGYNITVRITSRGKVSSQIGVNKNDKSADEPND
jgi:hypothetical protein